MASSTPIDDYFRRDEDHPIPDLDVVDINVVKNGGGSDLLIIIGLRCGMTRGPSSAS